MDNLVCSSPVLQRNIKPAKFKAKPETKRKPRWSSSSSSSSISSPIKVVYISNPMRVKATASEFRALVQELTGQDSELPDPAKFSSKGLLAPCAALDDDSLRGVPVDDGGCPKEGLGLGGVSSAAEDDDDDPVQEVPTVGSELYDRLPPGGDCPQFEAFDEDSDEVFMPQMLDNFVGLCPSSLLYGS